MLPNGEDIPTDLAYPDFFRKEIDVISIDAGSFEILSGQKRAKSVSTSLISGLRL